MKTILYTGARSGIAASVIDKLKDKNYKIYVTVHTIEQLNSIKKIYQNYSNIECLKLDLNNEIDIKRVINLEIDILINHAGIGYGGSILDIPFNRVRDNFEVNVFKSFTLLQLIAKKMIERGHGRIIITSSLAAIMPIPFLGVYCATKATISMLTKSLQKELKLINNPIDVVLIEPGIYNTGFNEVMLDNKYDFIKESYFASLESTIKRRERLFFRLLGKNNYHSIVKKIIKAIEKPKPKKAYRAPFIQYIGIKILNLFQ